jgi:hypothetical protein
VAGSNLTPHRMRWLSTTAIPGRPILPPRPRESCLYLPSYPLPSPLSGCSSPHLPAEDEGPPDRRPLTWGAGGRAGGYITEQKRRRQEDKRVEGKRTGKARGNSPASTRAAGHRPESEPPVPARYIAAHPPSFCSSEWGRVSFHSIPLRSV